MEMMPKSGSTEPVWQAVARSHREARRVKAVSAWGMSLVALAFVILLVVDILLTVVSRGVRGLSWALFTTQTTGIAGGLENAILGTLMLILMSTLIAGPLGILGGVYMVLYAQSFIAKVIRFATDILSGVPSIVIGYFGYTMMVVKWGWGFSILAASISLAILTLPYMIRTTESSLRQVPKSYLEGALALGLTRATAFRTVLIRPALPGILTGLLLAISIGMGETAPLIYTAGWSNFNPTWQMTKNPIGYLTYVVWTYLNEPYDSAHQLAYTAALLLIAIVVVLHIGVRFLQRQAVKGEVAN